MKKVARVAVVGLGAFGYALFQHYAEEFRLRRERGEFAPSIVGTDRNDEVMQSLREGRRHPYFHTQVELDQSAELAGTVAEAVGGAQLTILAIPSQFTASAIAELKPHLQAGSILMNTSKALDTATGRRLSDITAAVFSSPPATSHPYVLFAGGTIASEIFEPGTLGATLAASSTDFSRPELESLTQLFTTTKLQLTPSLDLTGVEYATAFKNVISLIGGIIEGMELSYGTQTYFISKVAGELENLVTTQLGGLPETFQLKSQVWGNDMIMSATGNTRNRAFGKLIGQGATFLQAQETMSRERKSIESVNTVHALTNLLSEVDHPTSHAICNILLDEALPAEISTAALRTVFVS